MTSLAPWTGLAVSAMLLGTAGTARADAVAPVDFTRDVIPVLTKAGCNAGACHGSFQGRGGFALSLLGFDPAADYAAIVTASRGRRVRPASPERSLLLAKGTGAVPHGGGKRLRADSVGYRLVRDYLRQGAVPPSATPAIIALDVQPRQLTLHAGQKASLRVSARWSDGVERDVTAWALFDSRDATLAPVTADGIVTAHRAGQSAVGVRFLGRVASVAVAVPFASPTPFTFTSVNFIDELIAAEWRRLGAAPAPLTGDGEFQRRVSLDLTGTLPTPEEARRFLAATDPDKRRRLIDELLERPEYTDYWSLKWGDLLRVHRRYVGDKGLGSFGGWLRQAVRANQPVDQMVRTLLTAQGNLFVNGPVAYYFVDQKPEELAETTAQLFLGVRLQCARCHHHPFEAWSQDDYYGLAAFFTRLEVRDNGDKGRFGGMQILRPVAQPTRTLPVAASPRLFGTTPAAVATAGDVRRVLADWITDPKNPYFARNLANRYWAYVMGRGLVEPIDDLRTTNPASHPALLDALAQELVEHRFDAKHLLRLICNSRVYQLQAEVAPERDRDGALFIHRTPRRLPAEVLLDAINHVTGSGEKFDGTPAGTRAIALPDPAVVSAFLETFGRPQRNNPCECARDSSPDLLQALHLINNTALHGKIASGEGRLRKLVAQKQADRQIADELYLAAYCRLPTSEEWTTIQEALAATPVRTEAWEDLLWALLNSPEFSFQH